MNLSLGPRFPHLRQSILMFGSKRSSSAAEEEEATRSKRAKKVDWRDTLKADFDLQWIRTGPEFRVGYPALCVLHTESRPISKKFAIFDMDWTLIKPKSGGKWPKGPSDWCWLYPQIRGKLLELVNDDFCLLIVSNQSGIEKMTTKAEDIMQKIGEIVIALELPAEALISTGENHFRKPALGGWNHYCQKILRAEVDLEQSIYVGDAAGRPKDYRPGRKKDFSCSDRMFAHNIGITNFHTPEEFFLGEKVASFSWGSINPADALKAGEEEAAKMEEKTFHSKSPEFVIMVGAPASGKSSFSEKYLVPHGYVRVNRDELKTQSKCLEKAKEALKAKKSVVLDNTNPGKADRKPYIDLAKSVGVPCRCFLMGTSKELANHLNYFRQAQTQSKVRRIPAVAYHTFNKRYEAPQVSEGFAEVKTLPWTPNFKSEKDKKLFLLWTTTV